MIQKAYQSLLRDPAFGSSCCAYNQKLIHLLSAD